MIKILSTIFIILICMYTLSFTYSQKTVSLGAAPFQTFQPWSLQPDYANSLAFIYEQETSPMMQLKKHPLGNPAARVNVGSPVIMGFPGAMTVRTSTNTLYSIEQLSPYTLYSIDTTTGIRTAVFNVTGVTLSNLTGITWCPANNTMYGIQTNLVNSQILTINMTTGAITTIGSPSSTCAGAIALASSWTGTLFAG